MAQSNGNGGAPAGQNGQAAGAGGEVQVRVLNQYIKDMSFENPSVTKPVLAQGENPNIQVEVNVNAQRLGDAVYESAITLRSQCTAKAGAVYEIEVVYGGLFEVKNLPEQQLEPFLLVNCPALLFPYLRRIVSDTTREGGFPPLLLDPIDFAALYMRRQQPQGLGTGPATA
jgi:preprotein translocase subunit SecB